VCGAAAPRLLPKRDIFIEKDSKKFPDTGGWGYAQFNYDAARWERRQLRLRVPYDRDGKGLHFHGVPEEVSGLRMVPSAGYDLIRRYASGTLACVNNLPNVRRPDGLVPAAASRRNGAWFFSDCAALDPAEALPTRPDGQISKTCPAPLRKIIRFSNW
jgi:hypothetical protein